MRENLIASLVADIAIKHAMRGQKLQLDIMVIFVSNVVGKTLDAMFITELQKHWADYIPSKMPLFCVQIVTGKNIEKIIKIPVDIPHQCGYDKEIKRAIRHT